MKIFRFDRVRIQLAVLSCLCGMIGSSAAFFGRIDFTPGADNFSDASLIRGVKATRELCKRASGAVWAVPPTGEPECIRYWVSGLSAQKNDRVEVYFPGDQLAGNRVLNSSYEQLSPGKYQSMVDAAAAYLGVPYIVVARPGTFGSSGEHKQRRREPEARVVSAALDEIKRLHNIEALVLVGQSGGGHVVASLLNHRSDIECAVIASGAVMPRMRWTMAARTIDTTGYADSYEPSEHLDPKVWHPELRVFVLGDPGDTNVPWSTQAAYADKLKQAGARVELLTGHGEGPERHRLSNSGTRVASWCVNGLTTTEIKERAAKGLKG